MPIHRHRGLLVGLVILAVGVAACGDDDADPTSSADAGDRPTITVTTNILGDVVSRIVGNAADVTTIMPVGADPHEFQASAQEAAAMRDADLLIVNGAGFEEGLLDVIEGAEADGAEVYEAISAVDPLDFADEHADEGAEDAEEEDEHAEEDEHGHEGEDPHFFTDPVRMIAAVEGIEAAIIEHVAEIDADAVRASAAEYVNELEELDAEIETTLNAIPAENRVLVTNHEVFGYFADRYDFEVVGTVIPSGSTSEGASAGDLADLVDVVEEHGVPAIFADTSAPAELAETLAAEVGDIEVVELFSESLGDADSDGSTYLAMMRTNAERIADALA